MAFVPWKRTIVDNNGDIIPSASVEVRRTADNSLATLFSDEGTTSLTNPFTADASTAEAEFFAAPDRYTVTVTGASETASVPADLVDARQNLTFTTRQGLVDFKTNGGAAPNGAVTWAGGLPYLWDSTSTAISDIAGVKPYGRVYVNHFGENTTPGTTDTTTLFTQARDYLNANGGGTAFIQDGTYLVTDQSTAPTTWDDRICIHVTQNNIFFEAEDGARPIVKLGDNENAHVFKFGSRQGSDVGLISVDNCGLRGVEIDGNRANQNAPTPTDWHGAGVDVNDGSSRVVIEDCYIHDTIYYGIGFQREGFKNCEIRRVLLEDLGADGIDAKDDDGTAFGNILDDVTVRRFGLGLDGLTTPQAGLDIRSGWTVTNFTIEDWQSPVNPTPASQLGLVGLRHQRNADSNFNATQHSRFSEGYIEPSAKTVGTSPIQPMQGCRFDAVNTDLSTVTIRNCQEAARISQREGRIYGVICEANTNGIILATSASTTDADQYTLTACVSRDNTGTGFIVDDNILNATLLGCTSRGNDVGLEVGSGATDTRIIGGSIFSNTTTDIDDSGTNTTVIANEGGIEDVYDTRLQFTTDVGTNNKVARVGQITTADSIQYEYDGVSTVLSDATGWKPFGRAEPQHFGVVADGSDQRTGMQAWLSHVCAGNPGQIERGGTYGISGQLASNVSGNVDVRISSDVLITALSGFNADSKMIFIQNGGSGTDHIFKWVGGEYNCENQPNSGAGEANDIFYFVAQNTAFTQIHLDRTYAGADYRTAGGDSHIFAVGNNLDVAIGDCIGAWDAGVYVSADSTSSTIGERAVVRGSYQFCRNAVVVKRQFQDVDIRGFAQDCLNGFGCPDDAQVGGVSTFGAQGGLIDVTTRRVQRSAFMHGGGQITIKVNASDIGLDLTGGTPYSSALAQALYIGGANNVLADVNVIGINPDCTLTNNFVGVLCEERTIDATTFQATDNMVRMLSRNIGRPLIESDSSDRNIFIVSQENNSAQATIVGDDSYVDIHEDGRKIVGYGAVPTNLTAGSIRETGSGTAQFLEAIQSDVGWQILVKDTSGTIHGRILHSIASDVWQFRVSDAVRFEINNSGPEAPNYAVASLPTSGRGPGTYVYATDGRKNGETAGNGSGVLCFYDGSNWIAVDSGQAVLA